MKPSLRQVLADSHIAAIAILVLFLWSLIWAFKGIWPPVLSAIEFLATAVAIRAIPYFSSHLTMADWLGIMTLYARLLYASINFAAAWLVARWVFSRGPVQVLRKYSTKLSGGNHA